jgi:hypothetical protein
VTHLLKLHISIQQTHVSSLAEKINIYSGGELLEHYHKREEEIEQQRLEKENKRERTKERGGT